MSSWPRKEPREQRLEAPCNRRPTELLHHTIVAVASHACVYLRLAGGEGDHGMVQRCGIAGREQVSERCSPMINHADPALAYMPPEKRDFVCTKFCGIAFLRTPILHVGEPGGLSQHIVEKGLGCTVKVEGGRGTVATDHHWWCNDREQGRVRSTGSHAGEGDRTGFGTHVMDVTLTTYF